MSEAYEIPSIAFNKELKIYKEIKPKNSVLSDNTINNYIANIKHFCSKIYNLKIPDLVLKNLKLYFKRDKDTNYPLIFHYFSFIENDPELAIQNIFKQNISDKKNIIKTITTLSSSSSYFKRTYSSFSLRNLDLIQDTKEKYNNNILNSAKIIDLSYDTIKKHLDSLTKLEDKLIFALYTLHPPRRLEYHKMKIVKDEIGKDVDTDNDNYYKYNETDPCTFNFNNYKTFKTYNRQIIQVCDELNDIILKWIDYKLKRNPCKEKCIFPSITGNKIKKIFKKLYDVDDISVNWIRKSYLSGLNNTQKLSNMTEKERNKIASMMAHSRATQNIYILVPN